MSEERSVGVGREERPPIKVEASGVVDARVGRLKLGPISEAMPSPTSEEGMAEVVVVMRGSSCVMAIHRIAVPMAGRYCSGGTLLNTFCLRLEEKQAEAIEEASKHLG